MNKLFKGSMFGGYKKKMVNAYIEDLSVKTQQAIDVRDDKISDLEKEVENLKAKLSGFEENASMVSNAIITAERKATEIVEEAQKKADHMIKEAEVESAAMKLKVEEDTKEAEMKLRKINDEIRQLKTNIVISANKYSKELDQLID